MTEFFSAEKALNEGIRRLTEAAVPDPETDARLLLLDTINLTPTRWLLERGRRLSDVEIRRYMDRIGQRAAGRPVQYILGSQPFMGLDFMVNENVLIPRFDTEVLAETVLRTVGPGQQEGLDLCTGSGCLAISLTALSGGTYRMTATDLSEDALCVARENARRLLPEGQRPVFYRGDLFDALPAGRCFDWIVSNPPYIATEEIRSLDTVVKDFEPVTALDGGRDGLDFYRRIAAQAPDYLRRGGMLFLEIGEDQGETVPELLRQCGWHEVRVMQDLAGLDRVVTARSSREES